MPRESTACLATKSLFNSLSGQMLVHRPNDITLNTTKPNMSQRVNRSQQIKGRSVPCCRERNSIPPSLPHQLSISCRFTAQLYANTGEEQEKQSHAVKNLAILYFQKENCGNSQTQFVVPLVTILPCKYLLRGFKTSIKH